MSETVKEKVFAEIHNKQDEYMSMASQIEILCYMASVAGGWHNVSLTEDRVRTVEENRADVGYFPTKIALAHSELSEALEGHRTDSMDDKLPHLPMAEVELADCIIRCFDLGYSMGYDVPGAMIEKLLYNLQRKDHTAEVRNAKGGKAY